jgi:hypothetical protein
MKGSFLRWGLIAILILFAPLIYIEFESYLTLHAAAGLWIV